MNNYFTQEELEFLLRFSCRAKAFKNMLDNGLNSLDEQKINGLISKLLKLQKGETK